MSRLEEARAEYAAALAEARDEIVAELEKFGASPAPRLSAARNTPPPPTKRKARVNAEVVKSKRAHGVPGRPGVLSDGSKAGVVKGGKRCGWCGRDGLKGVPGPGGYLVFHRAPVCGLPCKGANLKKLDSEDLKAGVHEKAKCPKCDARVAYK